MGSILGALSRANATLGSAAGAKLAVWECVELSHGLSALLAGLFLSLSLTLFCQPLNFSSDSPRRGGERGEGEIKLADGKEGGMAREGDCNFTAVSEEPAEALSFH